MSKIEERLTELGIVLPEPATPVANYILARQTGNLIFTASHGPRMSEGIKAGKVGRELSIEDGYIAARSAMLNSLASIKKELGDLGRITKVVKLIGFVNSSTNFYEQSKVINGASDLLVEIFGDLGRHARSSIGTNELPENIPIELELVVEFK